MTEVFIQHLGHVSFTARRLPNGTSRQVPIRDNVFEEGSCCPRRRRKVVKTVLRFKPLRHHRVGSVLFCHGLRLSARDLCAPNKKDARLRSAVANRLRPLHPTFWLGLQSDCAGWAMQKNWHPNWHRTSDDGRLLTGTAGPLISRKSP